MGNRANVLIKQGAEQVCLYTHWNGDDLPRTLQNAFIRGESRLNDFQYLTRIVFCEMLAGTNPGSLTGYGISQVPHDGNDHIITVNVDAQTVQINAKPSLSFIDFLTFGGRW